MRGARNPQWGDRVPALIEKHWSKKLPGSRIDVLQLGGIGVKPEESDMTERLQFLFSLSYIGEGNGNPPQCSCLENPRDSGAWWALWGRTESDATEAT